MSTPTHADLVRIACRWLAKEKRCPLVFAEPGAMVLAEQPDALGFYGGGEVSHVVECKVSRADFLADPKKPHRRAGRGMGRYRWYLTPPGLVTAAEVPEGWGLLYAGGELVRVAVDAPQRNERDLQSELSWLYCVARRQHLGVPWIAGEYRFETVAEGKTRVAGAGS